ncbi:hypothetical protein ACFQ6U_13640 [Streptomyces sp. NPDC056465]|uniref:hypothetical protein n=1 Tax=Streptomyces sp. NPDC056465 TaxID=3345829 RepID=UPI003688ADCD
MSAQTFVLDLDASRREVAHPHGIAVKLRGLQHIFPAELPADALDPILSDDLGLVELLGEVLQSSSGDLDTNEVLAALFRRPSLPRKFLAAIKETYGILLDAEYDTVDNQKVLRDGPFKDFLESKPSFPDYVRLTMGLARVYGVEMGKLFSFADSSESGSQTSNPISPATTESTHDVPGFVPDNPDSLESDG